MNVFFTSQTFQLKPALVVLVSFPYVVGTFAPTVRTTLVDAVSTLRITKIVSPTHANANNLIYTKAGFLPFCTNS
jgi:hypothetical protein